MATVPGEKRDDYWATFSESPALGDLPVELPEGAGVHVGMQCQTATAMDAEHATGRYVVIFLGKPLDPRLEGRGFYIAVSPNEAREYAAAILRSADYIDGEETN